MSDVSWAGPCIRAEAKLRQVGELFEFHKFDEGMDLLADVQREITRMAEFVVKEVACSTTK